jgi:hypothetical protein
MTRSMIVTTVAAALMTMIPTGMALANKDLLPEVKKAGYPARNCQYCHTVTLPKKETFKPEELNERGKWLSAEKAKRNAQDVSLDWLKTYPGGKEQK